jgi:putative membrane protein
VLKLKDGSSELDDGMNKFNDEGIGKIEDMLGDDLNDVVALIEAIQEEGSNYKNYSGISDGMDGNVKFIYKTDIISKDEEDK